MKNLKPNISSAKIKPFRVLCWFSMFIFLGCEDDVKTWTVEYVVNAEAGNTYRVKYLTQNGALREEGPKEGFWRSSELTEFEDEKRVYLEIERLNGNAPITLRILRNTATHEEGEVSGAANTGFIEDNL